MVFFIAFLGVGFVNVCLALVLLAIPPIITNTYVGMRGVDPDTVDAAKGSGMTGRQVARQVELPLAVPTIMAGIRISLASVIATATIATLANVDTLGRPIVSPSVYGPDGQLAACIVVALVTFAADGAFALLQRAVTPRGLKLDARGRSLGRPAFLPAKRSISEVNARPAAHPCSRRRRGRCHCSSSRKATLGRLRSRLSLAARLSHSPLRWRFVVRTYNADRVELRATTE